MASMSVDLITYLASAIVDDPEAVTVSETQTDDRFIVRVHVGPDDYGKVIGRDGRVAEAMRAMLRVAAVQQDIRARLEIGD
jgi:hypothetical protein